ncbi:MAG: ATP-dependent DNA helicase RecG [Cyclobacteriaceae bacterium]|nr:ATP-dependent DNA helicase RecG [Cyclobacteriaceae bacterium]MCH8517378.1 ATP-dependent DNA helicase RecG [Cyclobacteriaceae bacterium]
MSYSVDQPIEYIRGIGPQRAAHLQKELSIFTLGDLLIHYPFRYEDRSKVYAINQLGGMEGVSVQVVGQIQRMERIGQGPKSRLEVLFADRTGNVKLVWFKGISYIEQNLKRGFNYLVFGVPKRFGSQLNMAHPELNPYNPDQLKEQGFYPIYPLTEGLRRKNIDSRFISRVLKPILDDPRFVMPENIPHPTLEKFKLPTRTEAIRAIHFPPNLKWQERAIKRFKFEELFMTQIKLLQVKSLRLSKSPGQMFTNTSLLTRFYEQHLPFDLTTAQKRVIKEIYADMRSGKQMNRLLQGDVGSGKTIVSFICMLLAIGSEAQAALMAPTEILATQHFHGLSGFAEQMGLKIELLTGSTKKAKRRQIHADLASGELNLLIGTHALLEEVVQFNNLGLCVIDEQHRFGVAQRARLWEKNKTKPPHILVMTATPIPRTLAMSLYGDLDLSIIDELPAGRKPIETYHMYERDRAKIFSFVKKQLKAGRQAYFVYPLIEESETLDLVNLEEGFISLERAFQGYHLSMVHGKLKPENKEFEMQRFVKGETHIMVATTVIEVGVNVPNASVMVIENAERFGLAQLHQLRGRVGRGAEQSYCILLTSYKISKEGKTRIEALSQSNDGFYIADVDLKLRGPGDLMGTQQSGLLELRMADLAQDGEILKVARDEAIQLIEADPELIKPENSGLRTFVAAKQQGGKWSKIS